MIGVGEVASSDHRFSRPTRDEILRLASEAHAAGFMAGKASIVPIQLGDGERSLSMIRECIDRREIPARVFDPTLINRNIDLFEETCDISARGCSMEITAFPVDESQTRGWPSFEAVSRYYEKRCDPQKPTIGRMPAAY